MTYHVVPTEREVTFCDGTTARHLCPSTNGQSLIGFETIDAAMDLAKNSAKANNCQVAIIAGQVLRKYENWHRDTVAVVMPDGSPGDMDIFKDIP